MNNNKILLIEDATPMARVYCEYLAGEPFEIVHVESGLAGLEALHHDLPAVVLLDLKLPDMSGLEILDHIEKNALPTTVIVITAHGSVNTAVEAMQKGATDFLLKPFDKERLVTTVRNALERQELVEIVQTYREDFDRREYCGFIGSSRAMQNIYQIIDSAAPSKATVFITGQSGTGKEVCAEAIHYKSGRKGEFVALNCASIPKDLMESEIFGHVKGAFTGAIANRKGAASIADGGTLFLDEICEMDISLQAKLLRFIQSSSFQKVGSETTEKVDVRFVCATNKDPWTEVEGQRFREDLYYRLHVIPMNLPPLESRDSDVLEIGRCFLAQFSQEEGKAFQSFSSEAEAVIMQHSWPGNVRELQNAIRNAVVLNQGDVLTLDMLPELSQKGTAADRPAKPRQVDAGDNRATDAVQLRPMAEIEMDYIKEALKICDGNVPKAAAALDMSPSTIYRRLRENEDAR